MPIDDEPVSFNRAGAKRIVRAAKTVESQYRLPPLPAGRFSGFRTGAVPGVTAGPITAKAGNTAGSGDVTLYDMDENGVLSETDVTLKCWNLGGDVASGKDVLVVFGTRGPWLVVVPCS